MSSGGRRWMGARSEGVGGVDDGDGDDMVVDER